MNLEEWKIEEMKKDIIDSLEGKEKITCPNCQEKFREDEHNIEMCRYLNR